MIWCTGDLHGGLTAGHVSRHCFRPTPGDTVLCTGDLGAVFVPDLPEYRVERRKEDYFVDTALNRKVDWLAVDGNHDNPERLFGGEFPLVDIHGGRAYRVRSHIYYLKRGEVFTIDGLTFFAFGGAMSTDKEPGTYRNVMGKLRRWKGRTAGIDWWPQEVPSAEDYANALRNLDRVGWRVDHVVTHTCPVSQKFLFSKKLVTGTYVADPTEQMLQEIADRLRFDYWHFGHFHVEQQVDRYICHFDRVRPLLRNDGSAFAAGGDIE